MKPATEYIVKLATGEFIENSSSIGWNYVTTRSQLKAGRFPSMTAALCRAMCLGFDSGSIEVVPVQANQLALALSFTQRQ